MAEVEDTYTQEVTDPLHLDMRAASGRVDDSDPLATFFYLIMRDHLPSGVVEEVLRDSLGGGQFTNGWLAQYAQFCASRLTKGDGDAP